MRCVKKFSHRLVWFLFPKRCYLSKNGVFSFQEFLPLNPFQNTTCISNIAPQFFLKYNISFPFPSKASINPEHYWSLLPSSRDSFSKRRLTFFLFCSSFHFSHVSWILLITWLHSFLPYVYSSNQYGSHTFRASDHGHLLIFPLVDFPTKFQS